MYTITYYFFDYYGGQEMHFDIDTCEMVRAVVDIMAEDKYKGVDKDDFVEFILVYFTKEKLRELFEDMYDDLKEYFYDKAKDLWK